MSNLFQSRTNAQCSCAGLFIGAHLFDDFFKPSHIIWIHVDMAYPVEVVSLPSLPTLPLFPTSLSPNLPSAFQPSSLSPNLPSLPNSPLSHPHPISHPYPNIAYLPNLPSPNLPLFQHHLFPLPTFPLSQHHLSTFPSATTYKTNRSHFQGERATGWGPCFLLSLFGSYCSNSALLNAVAPVLPADQAPKTTQYEMC